MSPRARDGVGRRAKLVLVFTQPGLKSSGVPIVGTRTWGGVIGCYFHQLLDGTLVAQPASAPWFPGVGWEVENHGVDPDVEVTVAPHEWAAGRDPQLETALELARRALAEHPPAAPPALPPTR